MNFTTEKNRIYYEADGKLLAEITFIDSDENSMTINHTFVDDSPVSYTHLDVYKRQALIGPGVHASHGMERTHMQALDATMKLILAYITE